MKLQLLSLTVCLCAGNGIFGNLHILMHIKNVHYESMLMQYTEFFFVYRVDDFFTFFDILYF